MTPWKIKIVLDRTYGERLLNSQARWVWIVDTPVNRAAAHRMRTERPSWPVTTFEFREEESAEETLLAVLSTIDMHTSSYSRSPYTMLEVIGTAMTERITAGLFSFGFTEFHPTLTGFSAGRFVPAKEGK